MRVRAGRAARRLLPFSLLAALVLAAAGSVPAAPLAGFEPAASRADRLRDPFDPPTREFGVRRPMGLAYVPRDRSWSSPAPAPGALASFASPSTRTSSPLFAPATCPIRRR